MSAKSNNLKIGVFVLIALALFIAGLLAFGAKSYFTPKTRFETAIPGEVSGLSVGSGVQLRGVPVGKVTGITFSWVLYPKSTAGLIIVQFEVDTGQLPLPPGMDMRSAVKESVEKGLRAIVKGQGITGTSILALEKLNPANNPPLKLDYTPDDIYIPSAPGAFSRMLDSIEKSLENFQHLDFASIGQGVTNALGGVRQLSDKLDALDLQGLSTNANALLVEIKGTAAKLQDAVGQVQETIKGMKLDTVTQNANGLISGLQDTNVKLQKVLDKVGAVPMEQTVAELQETLQTLNGVLLELKQYPSGFFLGEPPLPAKSVQTPRK